MTYTCTLDPRGFETDLKETLNKSREVLEGAYKDELNALSGLSKEEIDSTTPDTTDMPNPPIIRS